MSAIAAIGLPILIEAAKKFGAPIVKGILEKHLGGTAGEIGGTIIDAIADKAGVAPEELPALPEAELAQAIVAVEHEAPELVLAWNEQQRLANELMLAEMAKGDATWTWAWRPAGMWLMLALVAWYVAVVPLLNLFLQLLGASAKVELIVEVSVFVTLFVTYAGLYMGGHTAIRTASAWKGKA